MNFEMEFHDSRLMELQSFSDGSGAALFHAYIYRSEGVIFKDAQESGWQDVRFRFSEMRTEGVLGDFGEYASDGELWVNGASGNGTTPLPADHVGDICLALTLSPTFDTFNIYASAVSSSFESAFELETVWNADGSTLRHRSSV